MKNPDRMMVNGLVAALFEDLAATSLVSSTCLLKSRLLADEGFKARGLPFWTITMPSCSKFLETCLEEGRISSEERPPYHTGLSYKDKRPKFLHGLWALLFDADGQLLAEPDSTAVVWLRQVYRLFTKLDLPCDQAYVDAEIEAYIRIEAELPPSYQDTWDCEVPVWSQRHGHPLWGGSSRHHDDLLGVSVPEGNPIPWDKFSRLCGIMSSQLGYLDTWSLRPKHGPGAVSDGEEVKYNFSIWPRKLELVFPADYFASSDFQSRSLSDAEPPARMYAVPKTQKGPRLIACEPTAHQWIQGGIQRWFEDRVSSTFLGDSIDFRRQEFSQNLALVASADGSHATVDLSAASDRLSTRLVEYVFQGNHSLLDALHACRSRSLVIPRVLHSKFSSDRLILLRKFAPMGSACTFPIQTIVFTMIAHFATCIVRSDWDMSEHGFKNRAKSIRVFGDDIIVASDVRETLDTILAECGLRVNRNKSFSKGKFREACGMDAYDGVDVTPAYIRKFYKPSSPEALASVVECSNNLYKKGMWRLSDALLKTVAPAELRALPVANQALGPLSLFSYGKLPKPLARRWNKLLHRFEVRILTISAKVTRLKGSGNGSLLQYFMEEPDPMLPWESGQASRTQSRKRIAWVYPYQVAELSK